MMGGAIRVGVGFGLLALAAMLAAWMANLSGTVHITLSGYLVETKLSHLVGFGFACLVVGLAGFALIQFIYRLPQRLKAARAQAKRRDGEAALAKALMALARGDGAAASQASELARQKLPHGGLPRLMAAQAALLDGRDDAAAADYRALLAPATTLTQKVLGLEGLYYISHKAGDAEMAGAYALQVLELAPKTVWALDGLMTLAVQIEDWEAARAWLRRWSRAGRTRADVKRRRAVLCLAEAHSLLARDAPDSLGDALLAAKKAEQAVAADAGFVPAITLAAQLQARGGNLKKARRILRVAWAKAPHAELARAWVACHDGQPLAGRQRALSHFIGKHKDHLEALVLRARVALDDERWQVAQLLLKPHLEKDQEEMSRRLCALLGEAEAGLHNMADAQYWQDKARRAPLEAGWMAGGMRLEQWQAICPVTGKLDGVVWRAPSDGVRGRAALAAQDMDAPAALSS